MHIPKGTTAELDAILAEYGEEIVQKLGIVQIPLREVTLRPELLEMN